VKLNEQFLKWQQLARAKARLAPGGGAQLESLGLVMLMIDVEQRIQDEFNLTVNATDEVSLRLRAYLSRWVARSVMVVNDRRKQK
jgi:hypothetical protein